MYSISISLFAIYLMLILYHAWQACRGRSKWELVWVTTAFIWFLISGSDFMNQHDLYNYYAQYNYYDPSINPSFSFYYMFLLCMKVGQSVHWSFETWWRAMNLLPLLTIILALKIHKYNPHLFITFFMSFYLISFYTGLKAFYGFGFLLLASGFLLKSGTKNKLLYILFIAAAGGFHVMYYVYLMYAFIRFTQKSNNETNPVRYSKQWWIRASVVASLLFSTFLYFEQSARSYLSNILSFLESEKLERYFENRTGMGFFIPVVIQLLCMSSALLYRRITGGMSNIRRYASDVLVYSNILQVMYYPLFIVSLTFMRLVSYYSIVTITASGYEFNMIKRSKRKKIVIYALLIVMVYYVRNFLIGNMWNVSIIPLFNSQWFVL